jgi:hypothetical protein
MSAALVGGKRNLRVDIVLRTLGLDICADTLVGLGAARQRGRCVCGSSWRLGGVSCGVRTGAGSASAS